MSLTVVSTPIKTVAGLESNVVAINSQVPFEFKREDYSVTFEDFVGDVSFEQVADGIIENSVAGDLFYLHFEGDVYESGVYPLKSKTSTKYSFNIPYTADDLGHANDLVGRKNYSVIVNPISDITGKALIPSPLRFKPKQDGTLFIDLSGIFFGEDIKNEFLLFRLNWTENYNDSTESNGSIGPMLGLQAKKQIMDLGGSNMWERLPNLRNELPISKVEAGSTSGTKFTFIGFPGGYVIGDYICVNVPPYKGTFEILSVNNVPNGNYTLDTPFMGDIEAASGLSLGTICTPAGKFLTDFESPLCWLHYKRSLSFLLDSNLNARTGSNQMSLHIEGKNKLGITTYTEDTTPINSVGVHAYVLPINEEADTFEIEMRGGPSGTDTLSDKKIFKQKKACRNSFLLEWKNKNGEQEQNIFSTSQLIENKTESGLLYTQPITQDFAAVEAGIGRTPLNSNEKITLTVEKIDRNFLNQLLFIKKSEVISLYLNNDGSKKIRVVVVDTFNVSYGTDEGLYDFTVKIQLPPNFSIENLML